MVKKCAFAVALLLLLNSNLYAEEVAPQLSRGEKSELRQYKRDSIRDNKRVWTSLLGGPSYTPEASGGVAAAVLLSFKTNPADSISQRSFIPMGVNFSLNGTFVVAGSSALFFNENKFRIYSLYSFRNEPANFFGVGFSEIDGVEMGAETTEFHKSSISFVNRFVWELATGLYAGPLLDVNYSKSSDLNPLMAENSYVNRYSLRYTNIGLGALVQYDTRDNIATPTSGVLLSATGKIFSRAFGGSYDYQFLDLEYRQFKPLLPRATLGWVIRSQHSFGEVPFTELPTFGSPFDLRGYYWGQYRDKSMGYGIVEYRQMFGTAERAAQGHFLSKLGYVAWCGMGTIGDSLRLWDETRVNYGVGLRIEIQPKKNFRFDIGKGQGVGGVLCYFNMTEAF